MRQNDNDVVVIGAGLAGLTAAATLARAGRRVMVLDGREPGGRARGIDRDGFTLNEGPHALYRNGPATAVLRALGITPHGGEPRLDRAAVWVDGGAHSLPTTPLALVRTEVLSPRGKAVSALLAPALQRGRDRRAAGLSLAEWFERRRVPADVRAMVEMYVRLTTYSNAPELVSASAALAQLALAGGGVWYLHGGWQQLIDGLLGAARRSGAEIAVREVTALTRDGGRWAVQTTADEVVLADEIVLAAGGPETAARLAGRDPGWVESSGPTCHVACLDLGLDAEPAIPILLSTEAPVYGSTHAPPADLAPEGAALLGVMEYLRPDARPDRDDTRTLLRTYAERMGADLSAPRLERFLHRMVAAHGVPVAGRPRPTGVELAADGLWAVGDWVGGPDRAEWFLADAAVGSARAVANAIVQRQVRAA